jgi:hypothetical protein
VNHLSNDQQGSRQSHRALQLERFVISVDGQRKLGFSDRQAADDAAAKLRAQFPVVNVMVSDQEDATIRERPEP